jgi:hypothetical protein
MGQLFKSKDGGKTWRHVSDVGYFRAYDIVGFNDRFYALYTDTPESPCKIAVSENGAGRWRDLSQLRFQRVHLTRFKDELLAVSLDGRTIYAVNRDAFGKYDLPEGFRVESHYNFTVLGVGKDYLYVLCTRNDSAYCILRTSHFRHWDRVACTDKKLISLSYWQAHHSLVVSDTGLHAKVWKVDLNRPLEVGRFPGERDTKEGNVSIRLMIQ